MMMIGEDVRLSLEVRMRESRMEQSRMEQCMTRGERVRA